MQQIARQFDNSYAFRTGSVCCAYHVECSGEYVLLHGLETENEVLLFKACISFSREQEMQVRIFARDLAESETVPRMMIELAEEYFSSASFDRFKV